MWRDVIKLLRNQRFNFLLSAERRTRRLRVRLRKPTYYAALVDTNVYGTLMRSGNEVVSSFLRPFLMGNYWASSKDKFDFVSTPFLLLEYLGVNIPQPPPFDFKGTNLENGPAHDSVQAVYEYAKDFYWREPSVGLAALFTLAIEKEPFIKPAVKPFFETLVKSRLHGSADSHIHSMLAWDVTVKANYPRKLRPDCYAAFIAAMMHGVERGLNTSVFRAVSQMGIEAARQDDWYLSNSEKEEIRKFLPVGHGGDYVDTELAQYAVLGWHSPDGKYLPVHCFTCDAPNVVEARLKMSKAALQMLREVAEDAVRDGKTLKFKLVDVKPGFVHCLEERTLKPIKSFNIDWMK